MSHSSHAGAVQPDAVAASFLLELIQQVSVLGVWRVCACLRGTLPHEFGLDETTVPEPDVP